MSWKFKAALFVIVVVKIDHRTDVERSKQNGKNRKPRRWTRIFEKFVCWIWTVRTQGDRMSPWNYHQHSADRPSVSKFVPLRHVRPERLLRWHIPRRKHFDDTAHYELLITLALVVILVILRGNYVEYFSG